MSVLWIVITYVIGSIPFGLLFSRTFCGIDPRTAGSGNVGSTNVARLCGKKWGAATLVCDVLKGTLPVFVAMQLSDSALLHTLTALAAISGPSVLVLSRLQGRQSRSHVHRRLYPAGLLAAARGLHNLPAAHLAIGLRIPRFPCSGHVSARAAARDRKLDAAGLWPSSLWRSSTGPSQKTSSGWPEAKKKP